MFYAASAQILVKRDLMKNGEIQLKVFCMSKELGQYLTIFEEWKQSQTHWVFSLYHGYFL